MAPRSEPDYTRSIFQNLKKFLQNTRWAVLWGLFLILLHLLPGRVFPELPTYLDLLHPDKLVHLGMFAILVILEIHAFKKPGTPAFIAARPGLWAVSLALLFGIVMEITQHYLIPNRFGSVYDLIANAAGCFAGWGLARWLIR